MKNYFWFILLLWFVVAPVAARADADVFADEPALVWYHHTDRDFAKKIVVNELVRRRCADDVKWQDEYHGSVSVALGLMLSMRGYIDDDAIVIEKCTGTLSARALREIRRILMRLFPLGDIEDLYSLEEAS
ncbi:hypothetical protein FACS1894139_09440 [Planctomycetales bacterium]|nr:hypothetical protein FACS1894107_07160 [Planctomycetales bacterium]GHT05502.1 hypothetical protein FACS1894139_09440 [Planctomycetales bacterium]GHV20123.1 hypothetical protein AGMMS49959_06770 [Planctomycetales bacterium]